MTFRTEERRTSNLWMWGLAGLSVGITVLWPHKVFDTAVFVVWSLAVISPLVVPGVLLAAAIIASGADSHIARLLEGRKGRAVLFGAAVGALTPVCGVTVLPLMAGLLAAGVPLAPVMAFWLSSPVTDPAMLATTAATLGLSFAIGKTVAAFGLGLLGGTVTSMLDRASWAKTPLRKNRIVNQLVTARCGKELPLRFDFWAEPERRTAFKAQMVATTRLMLICLVPAFAAEFWLNELLQPEALSDWVGADRWYAIPLAVTVGAPAYLDGYAALPLTRGLMAHGMSPGAAMGFLVSGGVISIWGAMAIFPVLRLRVFFLYLVIAVVGSLLAAYVFEWIV